MPARATIATGLYPHVHKLWDNRSIAVKTPGRPWLTSELKACGYQTIGIGKMHWHPIQADYNYDIRITLEGKDRAYRDDDYERYLAERGSSRKALKALRSDRALKLPRGQSIFDWPVDEALHADAFVGIKTIETIEQERLAQDRPWFMWTSFTGPHNPWNSPKRFAQVYRDMDLPDADFVAGELNTKPIEYSRHRYGYGGDLFSVYDKLSAQEQKKLRHDLRAAHYGLLSFIDEWMGKIIAALKEKGQLDNTMIIFSSDHGSALFDNEMLHKGCVLPTQSFVPFVVWRPGWVKPGLRRQITTHADLFAMFLELARHEDIPPTQGRSLVETFTNPQAEVYDFAIIECAMVTSIITERWIAGFHHITKETDLYDLKTDPMCHHNIAGDPEHQAILTELRQKVVHWRKSVAVDDRPVHDDIFQWHDELGDPKIVDSYIRGYTKQYQRLARLPDDRPGITGKAAQAILDGIEGRLHP